MIQAAHLREWEKLQIVVRRHWIVFFYLFLYFLWGLMLSLVLLVFGPAYGILLFSIFWMFFSIFLYIQWLNVELDMFVVTNERVIGIDQVSFLNRVVSEANLWEIQDCNSNTKGLLANILGYGTIQIQTAKSTFSMGYAPNAMDRSREIVNLAHEFNGKK